MYKFDKKIWNFRIRRTLIVSLVVPLLSIMPQAPIANAAYVTASDGSCIQDVGSTTGITVTKVGSDCLVTFSAPSNTTTSHSWTVPSNGTSFQILVVGGGGGGGADGGNGGGGGELRYSSAASAWVPAAGTELTLQVGAGGVGGSWSAGTGSSAGTVSTVSWGGSTRFTANPGAGGGGWTSSVVAAGGTGGGGGSGTVGQSATAVQSGCGNLSATQNNTAGNWYTGRWFLNGGSGAGTALTTTAPSNSITGSDKFYGGAGGGGWGGSINSASIGPIYGLAGGGTVDNVSTSGGRGSNWLYVPGDNHTTSWNGASAGAQGVDATGGGGGGGNACDPTINGAATTNGSTKRTSGGRGGSGVIVIRYTPVLFTVSFDANGGSGSPTTTAVSQTPTSNSVTLASVGTLNRNGFRFAGWNTAADGRGTIYAAGSTFTPSGNLTLFAQWNSTISYNGNTATTTRPIESTTANTANANTLSNGRLALGSPISDGLVLQLDGSDASSISGTSWANKVAGRSGAEASATLVGSPTYDTTEGAFTLNGTSQYFTLGTTNYLYNGALPFTVNLSFKASDVFRDNCLIGNFNGGVGATYMYRVYNGVLYGNRNVSPWEVSGTTRVPAGEIQYASMSFDGSYLRLYLNGVLHGTSALINSTVSYSGGTRIGGCQESSSPGRMFKGQIYNAQIYNRALSGTEIATNFQNLIPAQRATKTNYSLGPWTTSVDTGTSYGTTSYDLSALPTPYFRVSAENYSAGTLSASVGGSRLSITKNGSPVLNSNSGGGYGANARFATISGGTGDGFRLGNAEMPNYTFCGMARYKDLDTGVRGTQGRIFSYGSGTNWLSGWYAGGVKNFFHNEWLLGHFTTPDQQWHVVCDAGNEIYWDGEKQTVTTRAYTSLPPLAINWAAGGDNSNYEFTEAIVYDQVLSAAQIGNIYRYFENKFGLTGITTSAPSATALTPPTNYTNSGDATLNASWFSLITYDGNKQTSGTPPASHAITNLGGTAAAVGSLVKTGYRFTGWNTAANGSGTRYAAGAPLANTGNLLLYAQWALPVALPVAANNPSSLSPYMRLVASDYDAANKIWRDSSGNSRNVTRIVGSPSLTTSSGNGSSKTIQVIAGGINDKIYFDNAPISTSWTVVALSRYSGASNRNRIISGNYSSAAYQDSSGNWLFGQYNGKAGLAHYNGWVSADSTPVGLTLTDWVMSTAYPYNYRYNGIVRGTSGGTAELPPLGINTFEGQLSDYQVAEVIIFNRTLTSSEITQVEDYFDETYGLSYAKVGTYQTASTLIIGAGVGGRSDTFTAADGLGTKTFTLSPVVSGISIDTSTANGVALVISSLVPSGTYVETITATDQAGLTAQHVVTVTVSPAVKFDTSTAASVITTSGRAAQLRLNTVGGVGSKIFTMSQTSAATSSWITLDTSTAASGYATLKVDTYTAPGTYTASIVVTDSTKLRSTHIVTIVVNAPPTLISSAPLTTAPVLSDLRVHLDAGDLDSYSGSGSTWNDLSGNSRNGTLLSSPTFSKDFGGVLNFNGSTQYVTTPSVRSETFTVEAWVKFNALTNDYSCVVTNTYNGDKINYAICFWGNSTIRAGYHQAGTGWVGGQTGAFTPVVGTWYQLVYKVEKVGANYIGSLFQNGNLISGQTTSTIAPNNDQLVDRIGRRWDTGEYINGSIPVVRIYSRALSNSEITQNFNATSPRFLNTPTNSVTLATTQGAATSTSFYYAGLGTGVKTFAVTPSVEGVTLDTSTVNTVRLNFANTLQATDSATARVITQTITAYDTAGQVATTPVYVSATINPRILITPTTPTTLTTTFGVAAYDTFTATRGMGGPYSFSVVSSANQSAFTMSKTSANVGLLTVANTLPAGTYYETITATDSSTASTDYLLTVIVNPAMTLTAAVSSTLATTITKSASMRVNIANGTGTKTMTISSPTTGITLDSSTVGSGYVTINVGANVPANTYSVILNIRDSTGATASGTFTVVVNKWPKIGSPAIVSSGLKVNLDASTYSGSGQWLDSSGNSFNATMGADLSNTSVSLRKTSPTFSNSSGGVLSFNETTSATTNYAQIANPGAFETFTVSTWVKFSSIPTSTATAACIICQSRPVSTSAINYALHFYGSKIVGRYYTGSSWSDASYTQTGLTPVVNTWYNIAFTTYKSGSNYMHQMYVNGVAQGAAVIGGTTSPANTVSTNPINIGRQSNDDVFINGSIGGILIYNRALSATEIIQNYNAQGFRFVATNSGSTTYTTTQGLSAAISNVQASEGSGTKTFAISPIQAGITLDTSTANQYSLNIASTLAATDSSTATTYYETITATDAATASTTLAYAIVVNPPVRLVATAESVTTTSSIAAYDTFTATLGTGNKTFTLTGSPSTSGFTLTQSNNVAVLKVEPTANPGTYYETITATDSLGASTSKMVTFVVNPAPTITGIANIVGTRGYGFSTPVYTAANGTGRLTFSISIVPATAGRNTSGITLSSTTGSPVVNVASTVEVDTYTVTLRITDSLTAYSTFVLTVKVNPPVTLAGTLNLSKVYGEDLSQVYTTSGGTAPFTIFSSPVCTSEKTTYIGNGTNGILGQTYVLEKFNGVGSCNWSVPSSVTSASVLVVGGGGGGGFDGGGGGGGGGVYQNSNITLTPNSTIAIAVGAGGAAGSGYTNQSCVGFLGWNGSVVGCNGGTGAASSFDNYVASGGGGGGGIEANGSNDSNSSATRRGGGGGAGAQNDNTSASNPGQGQFPGGSVSNTPFTASGGGGSYLAAGGNSSNTLAGTGATGVTATLDSLVYGSGGGGGTFNNATVAVGGNGAGSGGSQSSNPTNPAVNRGGGGGGGGNGGTSSKGVGTAGASGVVMVSYRTPTVDSETTQLTLETLSTSPAGSLRLNAPRFVPVGTYSQTITVLDSAAQPASTAATVTLTVNKATPTVALSLPGSVTTAKYGNAISVSALASTPGRVVFKNGSNIISGCESVTASVAGVASCSWTPTALGVTSIKATLVPTDSTNYNNSNEATFSVTVGKADTLTVTASNESLTYTGSTALVTKPFTQSGLVSIDSLTAVSMRYSGTANDGTIYSSSTAPTLAGTYVITPDTGTAGISTISANYLGVTVVPGTLTLNRARNTSSLVYPTVNTNSAVTTPPASNYVTFKTGLTDTPTTTSRLGNGAISYATSTPTNCSVDSSTAVMSLLEAGSCVVEMSVEEGHNYLADTATATIQIAKGNRTISLASATSTLKYTETATVTTTISDGALDGVMTYSLNSSPGCSFDSFGGILTATSGTLACSLNVTIAEGTNFLSATSPSALAMTIAKADAPVITIDTVTAVDYTPGSRAAISPTYTISGFKGSDAASSLTLTYSFISNPFEVFSYSDTATPIDAGTYRITPSAIVMSSGLATNYETPNYSAAAINFTINRIAQDPVTIDGVNGEVSVPFTLVYRGGNNPTATATFTKVSGAACTVTGNGLNATEAGLCVVTVTVPANRNYLAITSESITVRVRSFTLVPVFVFGNGTTGISISTTTPLTVGQTECRSGCTPNITAISPYEGAEGDVIVLTGINFTGAVRVIFNVFTNASTFIVDSDTQISVQVPAGLTVGDGTIEVVTPYGTTPRWFDFGVLP